VRRNPAFTVCLGSCAGGGGGCVPSSKQLRRLQGPMRESSGRLFWLASSGILSLLSAATWSCVTPASSPVVLAPKAGQAPPLRCEVLLVCTLWRKVLVLRLTSVACWQSGAAASCCTSCSAVSTRCAGSPGAASSHAASSSAYACCFQMAAHPHTRLRTVFVRPCRVSASLP